MHFFRGLIGWLCLSLSRFIYGVVWRVLRLSAPRLPLLPCCHPLRHPGRLCVALTVCGWLCLSHRRPACPISPSVPADALRLCLRSCPRSGSPCRPGCPSVPPWLCGASCGLWRVSVSVGYGTPFFILSTGLDVLVSWTYVLEVTTRCICCQAKLLDTF